jgi:serine hydrolase
MANIFIIYGIYGHPGENWFPWMKKELEKKGHVVFIPDFPNADKPQLSEWLGHFKNFEKYLDEDSILIGHSLGVSFALTLIETHEIAASYFVAGFANAPDNQFDEAMKSFTDRDFDWVTINNNCKIFTIFHSETDPYIKMHVPESVAEKLHTKVINVPSAGHFNEAAGYTEFPELLKKILELF